MNVRYLYFENPDREREVCDIVTPLLALFPTWCETLIVQSKYASDTTQVAEVFLSPRYRSATIVVSTNFYEHDRDQQHREMLHEIAHTWLAPVTDWVTKRFLSGDDDLSAERMEEFTERVESTVESLSLAMSVAIRGDS
ncbi:MAG: hypothetical protein QM845_05215 [Verrucomicrobiota bacterium]|nr:hypothetical protein [Verrucomicrobiota bacterium]